MKNLKRILASGLILSTAWSFGAQPMSAAAWWSVKPEEAKTGFVQEEGGTRYYLTMETTEGGVTTCWQEYGTRFHEIDGNWYYFSVPDGYMQTGVQEATINSWQGAVTAPFLFDENGVLQLGLIELDGVWRYYYIWSDWTGFEGSHVGISYAGRTGIYGDETILYYGDTPYHYIDGDGGMEPVESGLYPVTDQRGWIEWNGNWYYISEKSDNYNPAGHLAGGWHRISDSYADNRFVYFDPETHIYQKMTGWQPFLNDDTLVTYFDEDGICVADRMVTDETGTRYINIQGYLQTEQRWAQRDGNWYFLNTEGYVQTNRWIKGNTSWYYAGADGALLVNQWIQWKGKWYYFGWNDGAMYENQWVQWKGKWYYLGADGAMLTNTVTPDGYRVDQNGVWIG